MSVLVPGLLQRSDTDEPQDCKVRTRKSQTAPSLSVDDSQYTRRRAGKVEEEICVLDSSTAHRRGGGCERSMGRDTCQSSIGCVGEGTTPSPPNTAGDPEGWQCIEDSQLFFLDIQVSASYWDWWMGRGTVCYEHLNQTDLLGETLEQDEEDGPVCEHRCFNCGSPVHFLTSCPVPHDHALINLSRQLAAFFRNDTKQAMQRIHVVEGWRQQRLEWLSLFKPGEIRGPLLRDALGLDEGDVGHDAPWLENISFWGYPRGWVGPIDPREKMRNRILGDMEDSTLLRPVQQDGTESSIIIFDSDGKEENIDLTVQLTEFKDNSSVNIGCEIRESHRWAPYPASHFLYTLLPIYSGQTLPPVESEGFSAFGESSFNADRQNVWSHITSQPPLDLPPPPPTSPPLLPPPPQIPTPPLPLDVGDDELDMDLSD